MHSVGTGLNMLPFAALVAYSLALHAVLLQRRCSHSTGGSMQCASLCNWNRVTNVTLGSAFPYVAVTVLPMQH